MAKRNKDDPIWSRVTVLLIRHVIPLTVGIAGFSVWGFYVVMWPVGVADLLFGEKPVPESATRGAWRKDAESGLDSRPIRMNGAFHIFEFSQFLWIEPDGTTGEMNKDFHSTVRLETVVPVTVVAFLFWIIGWVSWVWLLSLRKSRSRTAPPLI